MNINFENLEKINDMLLKLDNLESKISGGKRWLNINETAQYLGYSKDHTHKLKENHFFENKHYYKKAGKLLFDKIALDVWVTASQNSKSPKEIANEILKDLI